MMQRTGRIPQGLFLVVLAAAGCAADAVTMQLGVPGARAAADLALIDERGDYLDVLMESGGLQYRFFLPDDPACRSLVAHKQAVTYANVGTFGQLRAGETSCDPVGILSLAAWRDRRPRRRISSVIPRSRAELRERVYVDEEFALIRGRFLLASEIGFLGGGDAIAVIPNAPECRSLEVPGTASMEFRQAGKLAYALIAGDQLCPVIGFVQPPPTPAP